MFFSDSTWALKSFFDILSDAYIYCVPFVDTKGKNV